jgi:hypothetical protein
VSCFARKAAKTSADGDSAHDRTGPITRICGDTTPPAPRHRIHRESVATSSDRLRGRTLPYWCGKSEGVFRGNADRNGGNRGSTHILSQGAEP